LKRRAEGRILEYMPGRSWMMPTSWEARFWEAGVTGAMSAFWRRPLSGGGSCGRGYGSSTTGQKLSPFREALEKKSKHRTGATRKAESNNMRATRMVEPN